jgi:hypothetical protein
LLPNLDFKIILFLNIFKSRRYEAGIMILMPYNFQIPALTKGIKIAGFKKIALEISFKIYLSIC